MASSSLEASPMLAGEKRKEWSKQHPSINRWLSNLQPKTQIRYLYYAHKYFTWVSQKGPDLFKNKTPEQLLDMQDECVRQRAQFKQVDLLRSYLNEREGTYSTKMLIKSAIYSFYASNHVPLPRDINFKIRATRESVKGHMSIKELKNIILSSNKFHQAIFIIMFQSSMGLNELVYFNTHCWQQVKKQLDEGKQVVRVDLPRRKHRYMKPKGGYFTFFGKDGVDKLKKYLEVRGTVTRKDRTVQDTLPKLEEAIFVTEKWALISGESISCYFKRHTVKMGIIKKEGWKQTCQIQGSCTRNERHVQDRMEFNRCQTIHGRILLRSQHRLKPVQQSFQPV
ncbi:hypothetical protein KAU88_08060 [Candidatus Bathyarchaeota archaeon]|nr:hypothetical protein [Candidatus Bathyarchaeota archaeon]